MHVSASPVRQLAPHLRVPENAGMRISAVLLKALAAVTSVYLAGSLLFVVAVITVVGMAVYAALRVYEFLAGRRVASTA
ncbi:MAG TPA: hypothetical protein VNX47_00360 [Nevskia sp.]|jgi:hypothetical protein|nr:hypothetical protein [Nevskia sp.]